MNKLYQFLKNGLADKTTKSISFSSWHSGETGNQAWFDHLHDFYKKCPVFYIDDEPYLIKFSSARQGRGGMDEGSPNTITVSKLSNDRVEVSTKNEYVAVIQLGFDVAYKEEGLNDIDQLMDFIEEKIDGFPNIEGTELNFRVVGKGYDGIEYDENQMKQINEWKPQLF